MDGTQQSATVGATSAVILGPNAHRRALLVSPPSAGRVTITFNAPAVLDAGQTVQTGTSARTFSRREVGDLIRGSVNAIADAANRTVGIMEYFEAGA